MARINRIHHSFIEQFSYFHPPFPYITEHRPSCYKWHCDCFIYTFFQSFIIDLDPLYPNGPQNQHLSRDLKDEPFGDTQICLITRAQWEYAPESHSFLNGIHYLTQYC